MVPLNTLKVMAPFILSCFSAYVTNGTCPDIFPCIVGQPIAVLNWLMETGVKSMRKCQYQLSSIMAAETSDKFSAPSKTGNVSWGDTNEYRLISALRLVLPSGILSK